MPSAEMITDQLERGSGLRLSDPQILPCRARASSRRVTKYDTKSIPSTSPTRRPSSHPLPLRGIENRIHALSVRVREWHIDRWSSSPVTVAVCQFQFPGNQPRRGTSISSCRLGQPCSTTMRKTRCDVRLSDGSSRLGLCSASPPGGQRSTWKSSRRTWTRCAKRGERWGRWFGLTFLLVIRLRSLSERRISKKIGP